jgi:hypothetical protein
MIRLMIFSFVVFLFSYFSCEKKTAKDICKYNLIIKEIDGNTNAGIISFKNVFISNKVGLFEYDFKLLSETEITANSKQSFFKEDSVSLSYIPAGKPVFYTFDFDGNLLKKDSVKRKLNDIVKIDSSNNKTDPLYSIINSISENDFFDTTINKINFKSYKYPNIIKDIAGDMRIQLFFITDTSLKTPFNVNNRYPFVFNKYTLISDIRELTDAEKKLCNKIINTTF